MYLFFFSMSAINLVSGSYHVGKPDVATQSQREQMILDTTPICAIPRMRYCVWERCNFWDDDKEEGTAACFDTWNMVDAQLLGNPDWPCVISFYEDYD